MTGLTELPPLDASTLPPGVRARIVTGVNGLSMHVLEAGFETPERPCVLLLHGFPELAYSWRKIMPALAEAGFYAVAPDQRGYGRTTGWDGRYDGDVSSFRLLNVAKDALALVFALGARSVAAVVGHDFGSPVAATCALARPDVFRSVVLMSAPYPGPPSLQSGKESKAASSFAAALAGLAKLPRPRKHYQLYYSAREADADLLRAPQGLHAFLRAYYHVKSADWPGNAPFRLASASADELAKLPTYYIMDAAKGMSETVAPEMPGADAIAACKWLPENELGIYSAEYERTGFQGGLQWYRCVMEGRNADLEMFAGRRIDVPAMFIAGKSDWGVYQAPGSYEAMQTQACTNMTGCHLIAGAGHWVQQEQPARVAELLLDFLQSNRKTT